MKKNAMKIGLCAEIFFDDLPCARRLERYAKLGFTSYEFWFPEHPAGEKGFTAGLRSFDELADLNARHGLTVLDFVLNHPMGGIVASFIEPGDRQKLVDGIGKVAETARKIGCTRLIGGSPDRVPGLSTEKALDIMAETLSLLAPACAREGITLLLEPFNSRVDHPNCLLDDPQACADVLRKVNHPNVRMLYDIYHMQIMDGNVVAFIRKNIDLISHFHIAGVPGRHEPYEGELDYPFVLGQIMKLGYTGNFGLEYWPTIDHAESLKRTMKYLGA
jgi:hydroxypyruvate isomerase